VQAGSLEDVRKMMLLFMGGEKEMPIDNLSYLPQQYLNILSYHNYT